MSLKGKLSDLRFLSIAAFLLGCTWLGLEFILRGHMSDIADYSLDPALAGPIGLGTLLLGLAIRPRVSLRGEALVGGQVVGVAFLAIFCLPAAMMVLYAVTTAVSLGIAAAAWGWWLLVLTGAVVLTLLLWAAILGVVGGAIAVAEELKWGALIIGILGIWLVSALAEWVSSWFGIRESALTFSLVSTASNWTRWIPKGNELILALRSALVPIDHNLVISTISSIACGLIGGLVAALLTRRLRQRMMRKLSWRGLLPITAAPLPDGTVWLDDEVKPAATIFLFVGIFTLLWNIIF